MARLPKLAALSRKLHAAVPAVVDRETAWAAARMADLAPDGTGDLRSDIHTTPAIAAGGIVSGSVEVRNRHAAAVEFGNRHNGPRPFARPAARESIERQQITVPAALRRALK